MSAETPASRRGLWARILASKFLVVSIAVHLLFGIGATLYVVQRYSAQRKLTFKGGAPTTNPSKRAMEHQVAMAKKKNSMSAPAQAKRITTSGLAKIVLPEMPAMPMANAVTANKMAGMGGVGVGVGPVGGAGGGGMGGGGGGKVSLFGLRDNKGGGLVGTFYDFKKDSKGEANDVKQDRTLYTAIIKSFTNGSWEAPAKYHHYTAPGKLYAKCFLFPAISDTEAGDAFQVKNTGPGMWLAHYSGSFTTQVPGTYRMVGWGDNVMIVKVGSNIVLDASDVGYTGKPREAAGVVSFPKKGGTPMFHGQWFEMRAGEAKAIDVLVGDEGGIFCAGLFIQKQGTNYAAGKGGLPDLPLFMVGALSAPEKKLLAEHLSDQSLNGPVFPASAAGGGSLLDALKAKKPGAP